MKQVIFFLFFSLIGLSLHVHANELPTAFICEIETLHKYPAGEQGVTVSFDGSCSSDADSPEVWDPETREYIYDGMSYRWIFPAGVTADGELLAEGASISAQFIKPGGHQVTLWVKDRDGGDSTTSVHIIVSDVPAVVFPPSPHPLGNFPPIADAGGPYVAGITSLGEGGEVQFSGDAFDFDELAFGNNQHLQYGWDFDDGCRYNQFIKSVFDIRGNRISYPDGEAIFYDGDGSIKTDVDFDTYRYTYTVNPGTNCRSTGKNPPHVFTKPGTHNVKLTVVDKYYPSGELSGVSYIPPGVTTAFTTVFVNRIPEITSIDITAGAGTFSASREIQFDSHIDDPDDGQDMRVFWDFGDGNSGYYGAKPTHKYDVSGSYAVTALAMDGYHASSPFQRLIEIPNGSNQAPHANFDFPSQLMSTMYPVKFTDLSYDPDGDDITTWVWDYGDGTSNSYGPSQIPFGWEHRYETPGQYVVTLTVKDKFGAPSSSTSKTIDISSIRCKSLLPPCVDKGFKK